MAGSARLITQSDMDAANTPISLLETIPIKKTETAPLIPISAKAKEGTTVITKKIAGIIISASLKLMPTIKIRKRMKN